MKSRKQLLNGLEMSQILLRGDEQMAKPIEEQLKQKYSDIKQLKDDIPAQLAKKVHLYSEALLLIGKLHAAAQLEYGKSYADRKRAYGKSVVETQGTQVVKEGQAEMDAAPYRHKESEAEAEVTEWKNAFLATSEIIQALKLELRVLMKEYGMEG